MKNKIISAILALTLVLSAMSVLAGCNADENYPVSVGNITIKEEPKKVVALDHMSAELISYMGYDVKLEGRGEDVSQEWLAIVPTMGTVTAPDTEKIIGCEADIVFADSTIPDEAVQELEKNNITVIKMSTPVSQKEIETNYITIGKILGGEKAGAETGKNAYDKLFSNLEDMRRTATSVKGYIAKEIVYVFSINGVIMLMPGHTFGDLLMSYTGGVNIAGPAQTEEYNPELILKANTIFYADNATLDLLKADGTAKNAKAIKEKRIYKITPAEINRQGRTAEETVKKMIDYLYPEAHIYGNKKPSTSDEAKPQDSTKPQSETTAQQETKPQSETSKPESSATDNSSVASDYDIEITDKLSLKKEDENDNVKAMQQRLYDLGYVDDEENITGYYGDVSEAAVKEFQSNNGIKDTGKADNATLKKLFDKNAKKK